MIDGGGSPAQNFQSHLLHVRQFHDMLLRAGVPPAKITIFSSDGHDPAADLAVREPQDQPDFWLVRGTKVEGALKPPITYVDSVVPGATLEPATKDAIGRWFAGARRRLQSGDTLLLYVTDHGTKGDTPEENAITLWGPKESLSVRELSAMLEPLDRGVRVVALMSQCFSGAFAELARTGSKTGLPDGDVCGYFSSTADRPAYGCYPENRGRDNVGHSFHFLHALAQTGRLDDAHTDVLVSDRTPDVPLRSSDVFVANLLERTAKAEGKEPAAFVDELLHQAWNDKAAYEPDIRLLDRIGHAFGVFSPRSLAEVDEQIRRLPDIAGQLKTHEKAWQAALGDAAQANLDRFVGKHPDWATRLQALPQPSTADAAKPVASALIADLVPYTRADHPSHARLGVLHGRTEMAREVAYRMEVRLGVVLRMRALLTDVAGDAYLATKATPAERASHQALRACEDLRLPVPPGDAPSVPAADPFPRFDDDLESARAVLPGWMGIRFRDPPKKLHDELKLADGAAIVETVYPDSPALAAGLTVGDVVLGPPGAPFTERNQIRSWTMLSRVDMPAKLDVIRGTERRQVTLVPKPYPLKWPELPGPPKTGSLAPKLQLTPYRGKPPTALASGSSHVLFFWATWCAPCKASLAELLAFERERDTPVVAITDESPEQLDAFFAKFEHPFPVNVAVDEYRRAFLAYGVSGTPTFVLVDAKGTVQNISTGYGPTQGLGIDGWTWSGRDGGPAPIP